MTSSSRTSTWVRKLRPAPDSATRLICFPHAGGAATYYAPFARAMPDDVDVLAIQYPGRQDRRHEPCVQDLGSLADLVTDELRDWADRPFAFLGHSMGATVAFEVAVRLRRDGIVPLALFASGRRAPSRFRDERVHLYDDAGLIREVRKLSGSDPQFLDDEELIEMIMPSLRGDYRAAETYRYRPSPALDCPIVAFIGDDDSHVTLEEAEAWRHHTVSSFALKVFPGGHFYLNAHAHAVTEHVAGYLAK